MNNFMRRSPLTLWPILLSILSLAVVFVGSYLATHTFTKILTFNRVPFYLDYQEFGFIRRGLIGSFVFLFGLQNQNAELIISYVLIVLAAWVFWAWIIRCHKDGELVPWERCLVFLLSPGLFLHFGYDLGRSDTLNLIIIIVALYLLDKRYYACASMIACFGILNHESFMFAYLPLMLAFSYYNLNTVSKNEKILTLMILFVPVFITDILITLFGGTNVPMEVVSEILGIHLNPAGTQYYYFKNTSILVNVVGSAFNFIGSLRLNLYHLFLLFIYLGAFTFFIDRSVSFNKNLKEKILIASCFSPLTLLFVSIDKGRWFAMIIINLCVIYSYLRMHSLEKQPPSQRWLLVSIVGFGLILGPITVSGFHFPQIFDFYFIDRHR